MEAEDALSKARAATGPTDPKLAVLIHSWAWPLGLALGGSGGTLPLTAGERREGTAFLQTDPSYSTAVQIKSPDRKSVV